ncbi:sensor histidine kinase [Natronosporangium hydrolyticum]|uniref:Sensor-like histidine kinase SenX3 n=1 Tax=Natronosporangium hydrolyticum TaxID=2811111 RepID=A0A895YDV9_9ACTN|nr:ATP-binding protein [Natronosporangium hydrolyticum]QSB14365.1 sensor histidine kinase [Natronosporangium hydrolyticum]
MLDLAIIAALSLAGAVLAGVPGALLLRRMRRRAVVLHLFVLVAVTVLAVVAGVALVAWEMFLSLHDLHVLLIVIGVSGVVSLGLGWWLGRRIAQEATWADLVRERERQVEASRRELVAWVSHDLRTPLAGLRAMAEALEDGVVAEPTAVSDYHRRIRLETDRMSRLVEDLFELSRINAAELHLTITAVPLAELVSDAIASVAPLAASRRVRLRAPEDGWPTVAASEPELGRVLANLLTNAIHYTPPDGTVALSAGAERDTAWLAVVDTCGGIPEAELPRVFDVAFRGERARSPQETGGGGGLGLAIVQGLVTAQGGRVEVANTGSGCRFVVRLPTVTVP